LQTFDKESNIPGERVAQAMKTSRRGFLITASAAIGALGALQIPGVRKASAKSSSRLPIKIAGYDYDRVKGLMDGRVKVDGCDTTFEISNIYELNSNALGGNKSREVTEIGLHPFMLAYANGGLRDYTLIPVFPLRVFRHRSIFIRTDRGIETPEGLRGKTVATPGYSQSSLTWIRGILQHEYGVKPDEMQWIITAGSDKGKPSTHESALPKNVPIRSGPKGKNESELLDSGEVDAAMVAIEPKVYWEGHPKVARLFPDYRKTEREYFKKTGIFPIMHAVAIRNDVAEQNPWLPKAVFKAYSEAKQLMYRDLQNVGWLMISLPWVAKELEETRELMGKNYWPYGIEPNRKALEALFQYSYEQGLAKKKLKIEEVFSPSTLELKEGTG
jgi:4,5-dihydroxyphthalate decarboxylase